MINVNGVTYKTGKNITIKNSEVIIDGYKVNTGDGKHIHIIINGDLQKLNADFCDDIIIEGDVNSTVESQSGDIRIVGNVSGNVSTMSGGVQVGGDIKGSVSTMSGDIVSK